MRVARAAGSFQRERELILERFGGGLKRLRESRALSQEQLAGRCGLHRTEISLLERGLRSPQLLTLLGLAAALDAPVEALVAGLLPSEAQTARSDRSDA